LGLNASSITVPCAKADPVKRYLADHDRLSVKALLQGEYEAIPQNDKHGGMAEADKLAFKLSQNNDRIVKKHVN